MYKQNSGVYKKKQPLFSPNNAVEKFLEFMGHIVPPAHVNALKQLTTEKLGTETEETKKAKEAKEK